jgi:hypothetical protein
MYWTITREPTIRSARVLSSGLLYSSRRVVTIDHLEMRIAYYYYYRRFLFPQLPTRAFAAIGEGPGPRRGVPALTRTSWV